MKIKRIFSSTPFILIIALVLALVYWGWIIIEKSPIETIVIKDVPVTLSLSSEVKDAEYQVYGNSDFTVDVTVTGRRFAIQGLTATDITATAAADEITDAGTKSLPITTTLKDANATYEVTSLSKNSINVFFDTQETRSFPITISINDKQAIPNEKIKLGNPQPSLNTIQVSGPTTELDKISEVVATVTLSGAVTESKKYTPEITLKSSDEENVLKFAEFESTENFSVYIPVYVSKTLPLDVNITGIPNNKNVEKEFSYDELDFWVPAEEAASAEKIILREITYSSITDSYMQIALTFKNTKYKPVKDIESIWGTFIVTDKEKTAN